MNSPKSNEVWKNMVTLGLYKIMGTAMLRLPGPIEDQPCVVYQSVDTKSVWCRPLEDFEDRFVMVELAPLDLEPLRTELRNAVRTAWMTGVPDYREQYDRALLKYLGCEMFQDLL